MKTKHYLIMAGILMVTGCGLLKSADDLYTDAEIKRNNGKAKDALVLLQKVVSKHSDHEKAPKAQYLIAEIYYRDMRDFSKAIEQYGILRTQYPETKQVPFSLFMQGFIYANMLLDFNQARKHYTEFLDRYADHELAQSVTFELKYLGREIKDIPELKHLIK